MKKLPTTFRVDRRRTVQGIIIPTEPSDEPQVDWEQIHRLVLPRQAALRKLEREKGYEIAARIDARRAERERLLNDPQTSDEEPSK